MLLLLLLLLLLRLLPSCMSMCPLRLHPQDVVFLFVLGHFEGDVIKVPGHGGNPATEFPVTFVDISRD